MKRRLLNIAIAFDQLAWVLLTLGQLFTGVASLVREKELATKAAAQAPEA